VSRCQKGKTNLDFTEARDNEWQWHQLGHMQVCTPLQTNNHASTPPLRFLQAGCPSCRPTNSVKALKGYQVDTSAANRKKFSYHTQKNVKGACQSLTRSSAIAERPRDASYQLKSCQLPRNSAETTYTKSPDQIDGMKLEI